MTLVERGEDALPLRTEADVLGISRRSLYYQPVPPSPEEVTVKHRIDALSTAHPFYGSRKMTVILNEEGVLMNRKRVQRSRREMGIAGITPGANLSKRAAQHRSSPYLLHGVTAAAPNAVWGSDITSIRLKSGWLSLVAILDWHSRYVISWALDDALELSFVIDAVDRALTVGIPIIWNSDQGSHYASPLTIGVPPRFIAAHKPPHGSSGCGTCWDGG